MNCKPGDLAIIIGVRDERCRENIGVPVTCVRLLQQEGPAEWAVKPSRPLLLFTSYFPELPPARQIGEEAFALDRHLMRISPDEWGLATEIADAVTKRLETV